MNFTIQPKVFISFKFYFLSTFVISIARLPSLHTDRFLIQLSSAPLLLSFLYLKPENGHCLYAYCLVFRLHYCLTLILHFQSTLRSIYCWTFPINFTISQTLLCCLWNLLFYAFLLWPWYRSNGNALKIFWYQTFPYCLLRDPQRWTST